MRLEQQSKIPSSLNQFTYFNRTHSRGVTEMGDGGGGGGWNTFTHASGHEKLNRLWDRAGFVLLLVCVCVCVNF